MGLLGLSLVGINRSFGCVSGQEMGDRILACAFANEIPALLSQFGLEPALSLPELPLLPSYLLQHCVQEPLAMDVLPFVLAVLKHAAFFKTHTVLE